MCILRIILYENLKKVRRISVQTGDVIKYFRKNFNMTQEELANKLQVNVSSVQKYESGAVQNLKIETIRLLCEIFTVAPWVFIFPDKIEDDDMMMRTCVISSEYTLIRELNKEGIKKVIEYFRDIHMIDKYRKSR